MKRLVYIFLALASYALSAFANESEYTYTVAGTPASLFDSEWDASFSANDMVLQEDGTYQLRKTGVNLVFGVPIMYRVVQNHTWNVSYPNSNAELKIDCSGEYDVTFIFNPSNNAVDAIADLKEAITIVPSIALAGEMNNWSSTDYFTVSEDNLTSSIQCHLDVGTYEFKVLIGGYWVGVVNSTTITRADNSAIVDTNGNNSLYLNVDVAGVYTFVWTFETNTLTVMYPEVGGTTNVLSCTQAAELCSTATSSETYTIRGYVTQITQEYISNYNNITFWMADEVDGGQVLMAYRVQPTSTTDQAVKVGDYVEVVGSLQLYSTTPEVAQGGSYTILNATAAPAENQCGDNLYWEYNGGTLTITGDGAMYDYTRSSAPWNSYLENITAITLPSGITTIGNYAFSDMTNLSKISLPSSLLSIGKNAFYHCASLSSITIPANVDTIVPFAFAGCSALTSIRVNAKNTTYDSRNSCNAVIHTATNTLAVGCQNTVIPADVVKIGDAAFERATFSYIEIPNTVTEIAQYAFYGCEYLTTIDLPDNLTTLGYAAFRHCYALNEVVIPSTVTQVEGSTFSGCTSLTSIVVESGNTKYDSRNSCNAIIETATNTLIAGCQNTVIPNNVTSIGSQAFYQCSSLTSITIPNNVTSIGIQAFSSCSSLTSVTVEATTPPTLGTYVFSSSPTCYIPAGTLSAYQASDWAQYVGSFVEQGSTTTPASDFHNFEDASLNAEWQFIQSGQTNYWTIGTAAGSASTGSNALYITNNGSDYSYTISSSSTSWAYIPVTLETTDTISFSWKGVGERGCDYLSVYLFPADYLPTAGSISTPSGAVAVASSLRGQTEWQFCTATPSVSGNYNLCFMWRNDGSVGNTPIAVDDVTIGENTSSTPAEGQCGDNLYWSYANGTLSITGSGAMYDFSDEDVPWKDFRGAITSVSLPHGLTTIGTYAFAHCRVLSSITLPTTLTIIGDYAFYDCDALINMVIPESVTTIGNNAFLYCDALSNVTLPSGITHVEDNAFASCPSLTTITIPYGVTTIGNYAFYDCDALTTVNMPNSLVTIGNYAFANCDVLSNITIPSSVTTIGNNAFYSCSVLTSIHVEATTPPAIGSNLFSSAPICYIPCGTLSVYQASDWASQVGSFIEENCEQNDTVYNYNVYICYGESYTWEVNGIAYSESGIYTYSDSWTGETTAILNLTVAPAPIIEADSVFITENELPYIWRGYSIAEAGNYVMTEQSIHGCDSILYELYLTVEASGTSGLTYNVTVPAGTSACYIAGDMNGWTFTEMTKVNNTHFTITIEGATTTMTYKYCSGPAWEYVEKDAYGSEISARTYSTNDVVEAWANIYQPLPTTPASDYHNFEDVSLNAQWQFIQSGQPNYWTIGTGAGSASAGSNALYITNDGYNYSYTNNSVSVSWAYVPVELETSDTISFYWKGTAESSYDNMRVYLYPENSLPTAGSSTVSNDAVQVTSTYLCGHSSWQYFTATPGVVGRYNLCFMWKNDGSDGSMPIAVDEIRISQMTVPALPENQCGENLYWAYNNGTLTIGGSGAMYDSHELLSYRQQSWFPDAVTAVSLPNGMTHIGATAFADCSNLTSITIPSTVTSIGAEAFAWSGLERITLPESVQDIAEMAFVKCGKMTQFVWRGTPSTLGNVYNHMFLGCNQLDTVIAPARMWECSSANADIHSYYGFPSHIRYVEVTSGELSSNAISYIASSYESLTTLDISAVSNASLPTQAFASWTALETLHLPVNLTVIPYQMVYGCTNLSTISIPNYVQEFGNEAFSGCVKLHSIDFADGQNLLSIGQYAFYNCSTLVSVTVPEGVQTLGAYAFYNNASLVKIKLPSTLSVIGNYAFGNCQQLMKMNVAAYAPPTVSSNTFYSVPRTATVYVPESAINTYKSTYIWNEFFIESNVQDALDNIFTDSEEQVQKLLIHGQVFIIRNGKCYDLMGQEVETEK